MTREVGKPYPESLGELANVAPAFHYFAEIARDDAGRIAGPIQAAYSAAPGSTVSAKSRW